MIESDDSQSPGGRFVESDYRYYSRRAAAEASAASRAITPEARERRLELARKYLSNAEACVTAS